ncbi:hypothetical protein Tco_1325833 [Tanacetum coccineum]
MLWGDLHTLFKPDEDDEIWRDQQENNLLSWRLCDFCGIHILLMDNGLAIHMLIEKKYPLSQEMLSKKLEVDHESSHAFELLRFIRSQGRIVRNKSSYDLILPPVLKELVLPVQSLYCQELDTHNKLMKLMQFLMRLDDCYQSVRSSLLIRDPLPEVKDAYVIVSREESHKRIPESSSVTESKINATSFAATSSNNFKIGNNNANNGYNNSNTRSNNNGNVNRGPNPNLSCKNCGMIGHTIERCYELIGYPPGFKKVTNPIKQTNGFNANIDVKSNDKQQSTGSQNSSYSSFTPEQIKNYLT